MIAFSPPGDGSQAPYAMPGAITLAASRSFSRKHVIGQPVQQAGLGACRTVWISACESKPTGAHRTDV